MKTTISLIVLLACLSVYLPGQDLVDDVYFKPSDAQKITQRESVKITRPNYKNGAKEIIYIDSRDNKDLVLTNDSIYLLGEINDSIAYTENSEENFNEDEGYYLNDFKGSASDLEYAERIRRFHNPKFTIHISDPRYTDIYFLDDYDWNVYIDGSYAWVTPTWTNPFWDNYFWRPYSYNSWYWRNSWYSPYSYYNSWYGSPWHGGYYGNYYGGWGGYYGGYYGWSNPYYNDYWSYNYNPYYWGGGSWSGVSSRNKNYNEATRRSEYYSRTTRSANSVNTTRISGGSYSPAVSRNSLSADSRVIRGHNSTEVVSRSSGSPGRGLENNNTAIRTNNTRNQGVVSGVNTRTRTTYNIDARATERSAYNNTNRNTENVRSVNPTTTVRSTSPTPSTRNSVSNRSGSSTVRYGTGTSSVRTSESSTVRNNSSSTYTPSSSSGSSSYSNSRSGSSSYSTPSSSSSSRSSGSSYSGGSSSSGSSSRSSGGSSGGRR